MTIILFALGAICVASLAFLAGAAWAVLPQLRNSKSRTYPKRPSLTLIEPSVRTERKAFKRAS